MEIEVTAKRKCKVDSASSFHKVQVYTIILKGYLKILIKGMFQEATKSKPN